MARVIGAVKVSCAMVERVLVDPPECVVRDSITGRTTRTLDAIRAIAGTCARALEEVVVNDDAMIPALCLLSAASDAE
jgi:hypothetical protein